MWCESAYDIAYWVLLLSLLVGAGATAVLILSGKEKEERLQVQLSLAQESAAKANERAEKLKKESAWRRLSEEQFNVLISELRPFPTKLVICNPPEIESATFANDFIEAFKNAGWDIEYTPLALYGYELKHGVFVSRTEDGTSDKLMKVLQSIGVEPQLDAPENELTLFVGSKPPPKVK